jgi:hypothetical protein
VRYDLHYSKLGHQLGTKHGPSLIRYHRHRHHWLIDSSRAGEASASSPDAAIAFLRFDNYRAGITRPHGAWPDAWRLTTTTRSRARCSFVFLFHAWPWPPPARRGTVQEIGRAFLCVRCEKDGPGPPSLLVLATTTCMPNGLNLINFDVKWSIRPWRVPRRYRHALKDFRTFFPKWGHLQKRPQDPACPLSSEKTIEIQATISTPCLVPPILLQIPLCKKKILRHIKISANAWSTKCWWN